jgi:hypothetical protein
MSGIYNPFFVFVGKEEKTDYLLMILGRDFKPQISCGDK